ncbi:hypothetical protein DICVIV_08788 [Dictyocaulus viviparus]|uniref:Centriolar and ciliogenesis-associated protein HYLS1 C-terminal domain-containing protein n=1 Tax=Dictyocaulus viviparus TaxID=29172 RepID=A0A0D8XN22_DICVI|nr:hypothetical protein DICVIV_08788 [Dictyocaulus viviparus]
MSEINSLNECTEQELLHVCEEAGLPIDLKSINILKRVIDELVMESATESENDATGSSLFGSLSLSDSSQLVDNTREYNTNITSSPIRQSGKSSWKSNCHNRCQTVEVPLDVPSSQENEEMKQHNPTAYFLLNDAWRCLNSVYGTMAAIENLVSEQAKFAPSGRLGFSKCSTQNISKCSVKHVSGSRENQGEAYYHQSGSRSHNCAKFSGPYKRSKTSFQTIPEESTDDVIQPDPCLRRVNQVEPGQLFYRHDPVKKFELYREEWARRPTPGEQKRLALRWKVRECMLRQDLTRFDPTKRIIRYAVHPKDWSPKPYLD